MGTQWITGRIGTESFPIRLAQTKAAQLLYQRLEQKELKISMHAYGGFEFVGDLDRSYPTQDRSISTRPGDVVLYQGDQLVFFTGTNRWSYTPLGTIENLEVLKNLQGRNRLELILSLSNPE